MLIQKKYKEETESHSESIQAQSFNLLHYRNISVIHN